MYYTILCICFFLISFNVFIMAYDFFKSRYRFYDKAIYEQPKRAFWYIRNNLEILNDAKLKKLIEVILRSDKYTYLLAIEFPELVNIRTIQEKISDPKYALLYFADIDGADIKIAEKCVKGSIYEKAFIKLVMNKACK